MHTIDLTPLFTYLNQGVLLLLSGLAVWVGSYAKAWLVQHATFLDKQTDNEIGKTLDTALRSGVVYAMNTINDAEKANSTIQVNGLLASIAANYAIKHVPDAAAHFGLDETQLVDMALARLPTVSTTEDVAGTVKTVPVVATQLPPIT